MIYLLVFFISFYQIGASDNCIIPMHPWKLFLGYAYDNPTSYISTVSLISKQFHNYLKAEQEKLDHTTVLVYLLQKADRSIDFLYHFTEAPNGSSHRQTHWKNPLTVNDTRTMLSIIKVIRLIASKTDNPINYVANKFGCVQYIRYHNEFVLRSLKDIPKLEEPEECFFLNIPQERKDEEWFLKNTFLEYTFDLLFQSDLNFVNDKEWLCESVQKSDAKDITNVLRSIDKNEHEFYVASNRKYLKNKCHKSLFFGEEYDRVSSIQLLQLIGFVWESTLKYDINTPSCPPIFVEGFKERLNTGRYDDDLWQYMPLAVQACCKRGIYISPSFPKEQIMLIPEEEDSNISESKAPEIPDQSLSVSKENIQEEDSLLLDFFNSMVNDDQNDTFVEKDKKEEEETVLLLKLFDPDDTSPVEEQEQTVSDQDSIVEKDAQTCSTFMSAQVRQDSLDLTQELQNDNDLVAKTTPESSLEQEREPQVNIELSKIESSKQEHRQLAVPVESIPNSKINDPSSSIQVTSNQSEHTKNEPQNPAIVNQPLPLPKEKTADPNQSDALNNESSSLTQNSSNNAQNIVPPRVNTTVNLVDNLSQVNNEPKQNLNDLSSEKGTKTDPKSFSLKKFLIKIWKPLALCLLTFTCLHLIQKWVKTIMIAH